MSDDGVRIGIDLGTTHSLVAILEGRVPRVIPNRLGVALTPSAVSIDDDGRVLVGEAARARKRTHPDRTAVSFKRDMGTATAQDLAGRRFRPEELSALVLQTLRDDTERALGRPIRDAVVTVPAYFGELQRRATRDACALADIPVERIINEPTAAALAYGLQDTEREVQAVVLDLGGGTFDVTVLEVLEGVIEIQASAGDSRLGGDDFTEALVADCAARIGRAVEPGVGTQRLWEACERAKTALSRNEEVRVTAVALPLADGPPLDVELVLSRARAEELWAPLLRRLRRSIERALRDARQAPEDIEEVLLVGGSTRLPCVRSLAGAVFGRRPSTALPPDEAVALGAAVQAALKAGDAAVDDLVVTDVAPFSLGIAIAEHVATSAVSGLFAPILERGTVLPASRVKTFHTMSPNQRKIEVEVYQGEHTLVADNQHIGSMMVEGIPRGAAGTQSVDVRFTYDLNGLLEVDTKVVATGKTASLTIDRSAGGMSRREKKRARKAMERLKQHPLEALSNRVALARADALHVELRGEDRETLGRALRHFRGALETQEPAAIDAARSQLETIVAAMSDLTT